MPDEDYKPIAPPNFLEGILIFIMVVISALFFRPRK